VKSIEGLSADEERAAAIFRALGNPARLRIVAELARQPGCVTTDLVGLLPLAQSTVSQHLKVLKEAGIVQGTIDGDRCYCLDPEVFRWLTEFSANLCCAPGAGCAPPVPVVR
jgi:ArsR family transcriptional regulator